MSGPANSLPVAPPFGMGSGTRPAVLSPLESFNGGSPVGINLDVPLPEVLPIPDAVQFNPLGQQASTGAETNTEIAGTSFTVPANNLAVIRGFSMFISNMLDTTNVTWTLQINTQPQQGFTALTIFPRTAPFVSNGFDLVMLRFQGPATVRVVFSNIDGGAYTVGASFSGWFWPATADTRWRTLCR